MNKEKQLLSKMFFFFNHKRTKHKRADQIIINYAHMLSVETELINREKQKSETAS